MKKKETYAILLLSFLSGTLMGCGKADPLKTTAGHAIETCMDAEKETQEISGAETFSEPEACQTEEASETTEATSLAETEEMHMILEAYQKYVDEQLPVKDGYAYELIYVGSSKEEYEEAIATFCEAAVKSDNWKSAGSFSDEMYLDVYTAYEALQK